MSKEPIYDSYLRRLINVVTFSIIVLTIFMLFSIIWGGVAMMQITDEVYKIILMGVGGSFGAIASYLYTRYMLYEGQEDKIKQQCDFYKGMISRVIIGFFFPMAVFGALTIMSLFSLDIKQSSYMLEDNDINTVSTIHQFSYSDLDSDKIFIVAVFLGFIARRSLRWFERFMDLKETKAYRDIEEKVEKLEVFKEIQETVGDLKENSHRGNIAQQRDYLITADFKLGGLKERASSLAIRDILEDIEKIEAVIYDDNKALYYFVCARYYAALEQYQKAVECLDKLITPSSLEKMSHSQIDTAYYNRACYRANIKHIVIDDIISDLQKAYNENPEYYKYNNGLVKNDPHLQRIKDHTKFKKFIVSISS